MKITNRLNLPAAIVRAVTNDTYQRGSADFTVTELIGPPRIRVLKKKHDDTLEEDVSDVLYRLTGSIGHGIIERASQGNDTKDIIEQRFSAPFVVDGSAYTVSGQADLVRDNDEQPYDIWDWKFASIYQFKDGVKPEYVAQLNILKHLVQVELTRAADTTGLQAPQVRNLVSAAIYRDWSKSQSRRGGDYPPNQIGVWPVVGWTREATIAFIEQRIRAHVAAEKTLPECTLEERWARPTTYAIKKKGGSRAINGGVHTTEDAAERHLASLSTVTHEMETRRGENIRCQDYCAAAPVCQQWKAIQEAEAK